MTASPPPDVLVRMDEATTRLLAEAHEWRVLGRLLERPHAGWREDVRRLAEGLPSDDLRRIAIDAAASASEGRYLAAFGPSGVVSPREVAHCGMRDPGQLLAELEGCYRSFGYAPSTEDPVDHCAVEVGFMAYLRLKEAYARARSADDEAAITARLAARFADDHLRAMAQPVAARLSERAEPYLAFAAQTVAERVGPPVEAPTRKAIWLEDESWECGRE